MGLSPASGTEGGRNPAAWIVDRVGRLVSWLTLVMTLLIFAVVLLRYGFSLGWIWLQEAVTYLHALIFMTAAAWAFQTDDHVRVDIFYRSRSLRYQSAVNLAGILLFLVPFCVFLLVISWDYVSVSWAMREGSREAGGLPLVWLLKGLLLALPGLLLLQAGSSALQCYAELRRASSTGAGST